MSFNGSLYAGSSSNKKPLDADQTRQRRIKLLGLSVARFFVIKEMPVPDVALSADKTKFIGRPEVCVRHRGKL